MYQPPTSDERNKRRRTFPICAVRIPLLLSFQTLISLLFLERSVLHRVKLWDLIYLIGIMFRDRGYPTVPTGHILGYCFVRSWRLGVRSTSVLYLFLGLIVWKYSACRVPQSHEMTSFQIFNNIWRSIRLFQASSTFPKVPFLIFYRL